MIYNLIQYAQEWLVSAGLYRGLQVFQWTSFRAVAALIVAFLIVVLFGQRVIYWLLKLKVGDVPNFDHATLNELTADKRNTPTMGGVLISLAILIATVFLADMSNFYVHMAILCLVWMTAVGAADDLLKLITAKRSPESRDGLKAWEKLLFQLGVSVLLGLGLYHYGANNPQAYVFSLPFQRTLDPQTGELSSDLWILGQFAFTVLAVIVITGGSNAVNLTDGLDGLATGIMGIVSFSLILLCYITGRQAIATFLLVPYIPGTDELAVVAGAMCGACLGFLWFNCYPAQVFMGDTGSLALGGLAGYLAMAIRQELLLAVIGGVLLMEMMSVVLQVGYFKATKGKRLFRCAPIHHHFQLIGWTEQKVVVRFWLISALLAALALLSIKIR